MSVAWWQSLSLTGFAGLVLWSCASTSPEPEERADANLEGIRDALRELPDSLIVLYDEPPRLRNRDHILHMLQRDYPANLKRIGSGGRVKLLVHIDAAGRVVETRVGQGSGWAELDSAARRIGMAMRFDPGRREGVAIGVWVAQWLTFSVH